MTELDNKDMKILETLRDHGNWSYKQISWHTGIPTTTVHSRVKKLEQSGVIVKYTVKVNHVRMGKELMAYILIRADFKHIGELVKYLRQSASRQVVHGFSFVTGDYDIIAWARFSHMDELYSFLFNMRKKTRGVFRTVTMMAMPDELMEEKYVYKHLKAKENIKKFS